MKKILFAFLLVASLIATSSITSASDLNVMRIYDDNSGDYYLFDHDDEFSVEQYTDTLLDVTLVLDGSTERLNTHLIEIEVLSDISIYGDFFEQTLLFESGDFLEIVSAGQDGVEIQADSSYLDRNFSYVAVEVDASPVLDGQTAFVTTIDDPISVSEISSYITAYDETDGSLTHAIQLVDSPRDFLIFTVQMVIDQGGNVTQDMSYILDEYDAGTLDEDVAGSPLTNAIIDNMYTSMYVPQAYSDSVSALKPDGEDSYVLVYYVKDTAGNYSTLEVHVYVKDVVDPVVFDDSVSVSYTETFDLSGYITSGLSYSDNYDANQDLSVVIDTDDYSTNKTNVGSYDVVYKVTDTSGNIGLATLTIDVIDDVKPSFSGPSTLTKSNSETLTLSEITSQLAANDVVDGNLTSSIQVVSDGYTGNANLVGSYDIEYKVTDSSGNTAYHTVTIQVSDDIPPVFYVRDGYFISVSSVVTLSTQDIIDILTATGQISVDGSGGIEFMMLTNEYTGNETEPGIYAMSMRAVKLNGEESVHNVAIEVVEDAEDDVIVTEEPTDLEVFWEEHQDTIILVGASVGIVLLVSIASVIVFKASKKKTRRSKKYKKRK